MKKFRNAVALTLVIIFIIATVFVFNYSFGNKTFNAQLDYAYITKDNMNGTYVNYTEYWSYKLTGIHNGLLRIIANKELRSYIIVINISNMKVVGAYYTNAPYYNITFGSPVYYEPLLLFKKYNTGESLKLLNGLVFNVVLSNSQIEVLRYFNITYSGNSMNLQLYVFTYSSKTGYLLNGTLLNEFVDGKTKIVLYNQIVLLNS